MAGHSREHHRQCLFTWHSCHCMTLFHGNHGNQHYPQHTWRLWRPAKLTSLWPTALKSPQMTTCPPTDINPLRKSISPSSPSSYMSKSPGIDATVARQAACETWMNSTCSVANFAKGGAWLRTDFMSGSGPPCTTTSAPTPPWNPHIMALNQSTIHAHRSSITESMHHIGWSVLEGMWAGGFLNTIGNIDDRNILGCAPFQEVQNQQWMRNVCCAAASHSHIDQGWTRRAGRPARVYASASAHGARCLRKRWNKSVRYR